MTEREIKMEFYRKSIQAYKCWIPEYVALFEKEYQVDMVHSIMTADITAGIG